MRWAARDYCARSFPFFTSTSTLDLYDDLINAFSTSAYETECTMNRAGNYEQQNPIANIEFKSASQKNAECPQHALPSKTMHAHPRVLHRYVQCQLPASGDGAGDCIQLIDHHFHNQTG